MKYAMLKIYLRDWIWLTLCVGLGISFTIISIQKRQSDRRADIWEDRGEKLAARLRERGVIVILSHTSGYTEHGMRIVEPDMTPVEMPEPEPTIELDVQTPKIDTPY